MAVAAMMEGNRGDRVEEVKVPGARCNLVNRLELRLFNVQG
jgi:hypothetical protein